MSELTVAAGAYLDYVLETYPPTSDHELALRTVYEKARREAATQEGESERREELLRFLISRFPVLDPAWEEAVQTAWWNCFWRLWKRAALNARCPRGQRRISMKVFRAQDIPDRHKAAVYDALCLHFAEALDRYYTDPTPTDPRYDSGGAADDSWCMLEVEGAWANIVMAIPGWAETVSFSVELPRLTRDDQEGEGGWLDVAD